MFTDLRRPGALWLEPDDVYTIEPDGSNLRSVSKHARWPSLSPDGSRIAYSVTHRGQEKLPFYIVSSKLNGSDWRRLPKEPHTLNDVSPAWSPDGQRIAFTRTWRGYTGPKGIYTMDVENGFDLIRVFRFSSGTEGDAATDVHHSGTMWSPDGGTLAFVVVSHESDIGPRDILYTVGSDRSGLTRVFTTEPGYRRKIRVDSIGGPPAWSPDGQRLAFIRYIPKPPVEGYIGVSVTLNTINADGTGVRTVVELDGDSRVDSLSWSRNRNEILFTSGGGVFVADPDGSDYRQIGVGAYASWSPDGSRIAVIDVESSNEYLFTMTPDGSDVRVLVRREADGDLKAAK